MDVEQTPQPETATALAELRLIRDGAQTGDNFSLGERSVIGRSDPVKGPVDVDLGVLPEGGVISRHHAEIWRDGDNWIIKDLGSSNGTFVIAGDEQTKVEAETELSDGQSLMFGNVEFIFQIAGVEPSPSPEPTE